MSIWKKNYHYIDNTTISDTIISDKESQEYKYFLSSPLPLSENIHVGQLYNIFSEDTFRRFLEKKDNCKYNNYILRDFSLNVYKNLGYQILTTEKINKLQKQNNNKVTQLKIPNYDLDLLLNPLSENNLIEVRKLFINLWENIQSKQEILNWDTTLSREIDCNNSYSSNSEIPNYEIKFFVDGKGDAIPTYWDIPYTFFSTVAIAVHPKDRRYKKHLGREVLIPIINKKIPIITDDSINMLDGQWAKAINPWHDEKSIGIAERHNLPMEKYSIGEKGKFTNICGRFTGKKVNDFKDNIIKYLSDIGNLSKNWTQEQTSFFNYYSNTLLEKISKKIYTLCSNLTENNTNNITKETVISSYAKVGSLLPILYAEDWNTYLFSEELFLKNKDKNDSENKILALLLIHLMLEGKLKKNFSLEDCIQQIYSPSILQNSIKKYESYLNSYEKLFKKYINKEEGSKSIAKLKELIQISFESCNSDTLYLVLKNNPYLIKNDAWNYSISRKNIFNTDQELTLQNSLYFHQDFLMMPIYLQSIVSPITWIICINKDNTIQHKMLQEIISYLRLDNTKDTSESHIGKHEYYIFDTLYNKDDIAFNFKNSKIVYSQIQNIIKQNGPDTIRILFLKSQKNFDENEIETEISYINRLIQKIWNISRYAFYEKDLDNTISTTLKDNLDSFNPFDLWILKQINEIRYNIKENMSNNKHIDTLSLLEHFITEHLDHYIEIQKYTSTAYSFTILQYCVLFLLQEIEIYTPLLCKTIQNIFDYTSIELPPITIESLEYKSVIFNDIITKIKELKLQNNYMKHEKIDCIIQCWPDMHYFLQEYKAIITNIFPIEKLEISEDKIKIPSEYIEDTIIDISLWIKKVDNIQTKKESQEEIRKHIAEIEDEIQRKKILLGRILPLWDNEKIKAKKEEIQQLKNHLIELQTTAQVK